MSVAKLQCRHVDCDEDAGQLSWRPPPPTNLLTRGSAVAELLRRIGGRNFLVLAKAVLLQRRIVMFGAPASTVSAAVLGIAGCLPQTLESVAGGIESELDVPYRSSWLRVGLTADMPGWLSGGGVGGLQPHSALQALGEVLAEGDSGGRLLGCSANVARLVLAQMRRSTIHARSCGTSSLEKVTNNRASWACRLAV